MVGCCLVGVDIVKLEWFIDVELLQIEPGLFVVDIVYTLSWVSQESFFCCRQSGEFEILVLAI